MSFLIKNPLINLIISIVPVNESTLHILATDFKRYFVEKHVNNDILEERMIVNIFILFLISSKIFKVIF